MCFFSKDLLIFIFQFSKFFFSITKTNQPKEKYFDPPFFFPLSVFFPGPHKIYFSQRMHSQLSLLLLIFTAFAAIASVLPSSSPVFSAVATTETPFTGSNRPTNALLSRAPEEQQVGIPSAKCSCRTGAATFLGLLHLQHRQLVSGAKT